VLSTQIDYYWKLMSNTRALQN